MPTEYAILTSIMFAQLPNIITLLRILGVVFIFWFTPYTTNNWLIVSGLIYLVICVTDLLDGWIARKFNLVTDLGKILDPFADKILVLVMLPLLEMQMITSFPVFIILAREFAIMALRVVSAKEGTIISASLSGKIKTAVTLPTCGLLLSRVPVELVDLPSILVPFEQLRLWILMIPQWVMSSLIWLMVILTIWSFLDYFGHFLWAQYVKKHGSESNAKRALKTIIPNTFSFMNLFCGVLAMLFASYQNFNAAIGLIILGAFFDVFDGFLARKLNAYSNLGERLDSKADFVSFGLAPAVMLFHILKRFDLTIIICVGLALLYVGCVYYRLKRFSKTGHSNYFEGMPSPMGALWVMLSAYFFNFNGVMWYWLSLSVIVSFMMVSKFIYPHLSTLMPTKIRYLLYMIPVVFVFNFFGTVEFNYYLKVFVALFCFSMMTSYLLSPVFYYLNIMKKELPE